MKINLFCNEGEDLKFSRLNNFNLIVGWSLRKAFRKRGIECYLVKDKVLHTKAPPKADHSIAISGKMLHMIRDRPVYRQRLESATTGKTAGFLDSDFSRWNNVFDCVFTVVKPRPGKKRYFYAGWGADPEFFYPEQEERAIYVDSLDCLTKEKHKGRFDHVYTAYKSVLEKTDLTLYSPVPGYRKRVGYKWSDIQRIMRKCHFYLCTQWGESGLTRIEAATCGALLVVPEELYRPRTMNFVEHKLWSTEKELVSILSSDTDVEAIRRRALKHSWDKVVRRMLKALEKG